MKYELTENTNEGLSQIRCIESFANVKSGDLGGWIEKEENLSQEGESWISETAWISGNAKISGNIARSLK